MQMQGAPKEKGKDNTVVENRKQEVVAAAEEQEVRDVAEVDLKEVFSYISQNFKEYHDLLNFAYFLYLKNYVREVESGDEDYLRFDVKVYYCNNATNPSADEVNNKSRLEQAYCAELFSNCYRPLWVRKDRLPADISEHCRVCDGCEQPFAFCPYILCGMVQKIAKKTNRTAREIFGMLLKENLKSFNMGPKNIQLDVSQEDANILKAINAKSAYGAFLLLQGDFIRQKEINSDGIFYSYLPLCRGDKKESIVNEIISFWKTGSGISSSLAANDMASILTSKRDGCRRCGFEQCPDKLAAYFLWVADKYNCSALDLAYFIANSTTYAGLDSQQNWQFDRFLSNVRESSMKESCKAEYVKMIKYIVARQKNYRVPFLPFNLIVMSSDKDIATNIVHDFHNALWYFDYFKVGRDKTKSKEIYIATTPFADLIEEYQTAAAGTTIILRQVELLQENDAFQAEYHKLLKIMEDRSKEIITVVIGEKYSLESFFNSYSEFKEKIFRHELEMLDMDKESVYDKLERKLEENLSLTDEIRAKLERYVSVAYPSSKLRSMSFVNDTYEKIMFNHYNFDVNAGTQLLDTDLPYVKPPRTEGEIFSELDGMVGLSEVKQKLRDINNLIKFNIKTQKTGKSRINMHMVFTGNAGTGKTTVARLTAEILHSIGFIQEDKLVVCSAKDLIGEYLGQTAPKTAKKCEEAYNGVLFIDEAYQLNPYTSNSTDVYKEECIAELIQQMENNRDRLVVIFAGYTDETMAFIEKANTGLKSRIGETIEFQDYSSEELLQIFENIVKKAGMKLEDEAKEKALQIFNSARVNASHFGNARYARNLFERSLVQHAALTADCAEDDPELLTLRADAITCPV